MIVVELIGGMGNQMFQYATAYNLGKLLDQPVFIDKSGYQPFVGAHFSLQSLSPEKAVRSKFSTVEWLKYRVMKKVVSWHEKILGTRFETYTLVRILYEFGIVVSHAKIRRHIEWRIFKDRKVILLSGYFQCKNYFKEYLNEIEEMYIERLLGEKSIATSYYDRICVHIRCGDYIGNEYFQVCTSEYYVQGIELLKEDHPEAEIEIFSDDLQYVKKHIEIPYEVKYFENASEKETLNEMRKCKYFVISNSTFSWWAQELCKFKDKKVVAPSVWYGNGMESLLYDPDWIVVDAD